MHVFGQSEFAFNACCPEVHCCMDLKHSTVEINDASIANLVEADYYCGPMHKIWPLNMLALKYGPSHKHLLKTCYTCAKIL